jgi:hypothetical protein
MLRSQTREAGTSRPGTNSLHWLSAAPVVIEIDCSRLQKKRTIRVMGLGTLRMPGEECAQCAQLTE